MTEASLPTSLLPRERQEQIYALLQKRRFASVKDLAEALAVSEMTIRRDLAALGSRGLVERVFGGAQVLEQSGREQGYTQRLHQHQPAKELIARRARQRVFEGDTVALDASTTAVYLARELKGRNITVVTNSLLVAEAVADSNTQLIVLGGLFRPVARSLVGPMTEANLQGLHVDKTFFSAKGVTLKAGFTDSQMTEVAVKRLLIQAAAQKIALVDGSKFGHTALHTVVPLAAVDLLISDTRLPEDVQAELETSGTAWEVAGG